MPIKGLTDRDSIKPQFPRLGKLRKGGPKTNPKKPGLELDHWRFTSDSADVAQAFIEIYGDQPRVVNVYLPYATLEDNFSTWKEAWAAGGLQHRCDGETCVIHRKGAGYSTEPVPCPGGCKEVGRLIVVIPELVQAGHIGTVTMETHGNHDLRAVAGVLLAIEAEMERSGRHPDLRGIPFSLARVQEEVSAPGWGDNAGKRQRVKKWNVRLWPHRDVAREMLMSAEPVKALPSGSVDFETGEIIDHDDIPDYDDEPAIPTLNEIGEAMLAVGPSGDPLGKFDRAVWGKVASVKGAKYSPELKAHAALLFETDPRLIIEWRNEHGEALDAIAAQDAPLDEEIPPEAY